jgi:hypothetical protein
VFVKDRPSLTLNKNELRGLLTGEVLDKIAEDVANRRFVVVHKSIVVNDAPNELDGMRLGIVRYQLREIGDRERTHSGKGERIMQM